MLNRQAIAVSHSFSQLVSQSIKDSYDLLFCQDFNRRGATVLRGCAALSCVLLVIYARGGDYG